LCVQAAPTTSRAQSVSGNNPSTEVSGVVVTAPARTVPGITPDRSYDQASISAYGDDTVGAVLGQIMAQQGDGAEPPVVLVNGKLVANLADISDFPPEAVSRLDVLPRGSGARFGGSSTQRVYNIALRRTFASQIVSVSDTAATEGDWSSQSASLNFTRIRSMDRLNVRLSASNRASLLESRRDVLQPASGVPYALRGNIVPDPGSGSGAIDPALSALVGHSASVAGVPAGATPTLTDFAAAADHPNVTDLGRYRTLVPSSRTIDFGLEGAKQINQRLSASLNAHVDVNDSTALSGLPSRLFVLPATSPYSPFSRDVGMAAYAARPLSNHIDAARGGVNAALNADFGRWQGQLTGSYDQADTHTNATAPALQPKGVTPVLSPNLGNPFAGDLSKLIPLVSNSTASRASTTNLQLLLMGRPLDLPAGPMHVSIGAGWSENSLWGSSRNFGSINSQSSRRSQGNGVVTADIPLTSASQRPFEAFGDLSLNLSYGGSEVSGVGTLRQSSYGLQWSPRNWLHLTAGRNEIQCAPSLLLEDAPEAVTSGVRYFDVVTGQTVDVTAVTGGTSSHTLEQERTDHVGVTLTPLRSINLQIRAEYFAETDHNALAGLPPTSAAVMAAFPSRFVRGSAGQLTLVDLRPINLDQTRKERLSWGFDFDTQLGANAVQFSFDHTYFLRNEIEVGRGLPTVDLLEGGALGIGGDGARHQVDLNLGVTRPGGGIELTGAWRSESFLQTGSAAEGRLRFEPIATLGLKAFIDIGSLMPDTGWAKGVRITLMAENLTDARQRVADASGATPLEYQGPYLDAIGRTVGVQLRKAF
jgi:hypothetical protein